MTPEEVAAIKADHRSGGDSDECVGDNYDCGYLWPCPTYRLAAALLRVEELARKWEREARQVSDRSDSTRAAAHSARRQALRELRIAVAEPT